jgi:hypothetical protein
MRYERGKVSSQARVVVGASVALFVVAWLYFGSGPDPIEVAVVPESPASVVVVATESPASVEAPAVVAVAKEAAKAPPVIVTATVSKKSDKQPAKQPATTQVDEEAAAYAKAEANAVRAKCFSRLADLAIDYDIYNGKMEDRGSMSEMATSSCFRWIEAFKAFFASVPPR